MLAQIRSVLEELLTSIAAISRRLVLRHVVDQHCFFLEDLQALGARVNFTFEVDKAVNPQLFFHFEAERAVGAFEVLSVALLVGVDGLLVGVAGCFGGKETGADCRRRKR